MIPYIKRLFTDEGLFVTTIRSILGALGMAIEAGMTPEIVPHWLSIPAIGAALFMRSSASNGKKQQPNP